MPKIYLATDIAAPIEICFDLSRSIEFHEASTPPQSQEKAIAGKTSGLIEANEDVTWHARHLGMWRTMTVRILSMHRPHAFVDSMVEGPFKRFEHTHQFQTINGITCMKDTFNYTSPLGILGRVVDAIFLKKYMEQLLKERNRSIKEAAETGKWKTYLSERERL